MKSLFNINTFQCLLLIVLSTSPALAQWNLLDLFPDRKKEWLRVSTEANTTIQVSTGSLVLEPGRRIRATFRFNLSKQESAFGKPEAKYKTRIETIQFDTLEYNYRIIETTLLDSSGNVVYKSAPDVTPAWKPIRGITASKFYDAATNLSPLGAWAVVASRYPKGTIPPLGDHADDRLIRRGPDGVSNQNPVPTLHSRVITQVNNFEVERKTCSRPSYESGTLSNAEFVKWTDFSLKDAGIPTDAVNVIKIKCESADPVSEIHLLLLASATRATLISGGVLFDLEKLKY